MPELPEVETIAQELRRKLSNSTITNVFVGSKKLRKPYPPNVVKNLNGATIKTVSRHGKALLLELDIDKYLLFHLGMSGKLDLHTQDAFSSDSLRERAKHEHFALKIRLPNQETLELSFIDPRRFGMIELIESIDELKGMDPITGEGFSFTALKGALNKTSAPIRGVLLRQDIVTGIGNIYVSEILHKAHLHPSVSANLLSDSEIRVLFDAIVEILKLAIEKGGSSIRDYVHSDGTQGTFQNYHQVYDKEGEKCKFCQKEDVLIQKEVMGGRSTYFCMTCQPLKKRLKKHRS